MAIYKGGRGLKAPYETTHVRIPTPIKETVQTLIDSYKETLDPEESLKVLTGLPSNLLTPNQAIEKAKNILSQKKSARVSLEKLLTAIYGEEIRL